MASSHSSSVAGGVPVMAEFSPSRRFLAVVLDAGSLKVWDTRTGQVQSDYTPPDHLENGLTSLAWTTAAATSASSSTSSVSVEHDSLVAVGNSAGDIAVWNVVSAEVQLELKKTNAQIRGGIRHLAINGAQTHLYACSSSSTVVEYNLHTGALARSFVVGSACLLYTSPSPRDRG